MSDRVPSLEALKAQLERDLTSPAHALAGAGGGAISLGLTYPLYTIITKLQVRSNYGGPIDTFFHVLREEGWTSLYAGLTPALIGNAYAQGVYYYWYAFFRAMAEGHGATKRPVGTLLSLLIGALAGAITVIFTNPFWVVTTRLQTSRETTKKDDEPFRARPKHKSIMQTINEIYSEGGLKAFWNGLIPSLILVINPALQYMVYEQIKAVWERRSANHKLSSFDFFLLGAIAKTVATVVTYPYITVKTRLQAKGKYTGTLDVIQKIYMQEGAGSFFKGMESKIVQSVLTAAFLFMVQNKLATFFLRLLVWFYTRRNPVPIARK